MRTALMMVFTIGMSQTELAAESYPRPELLVEPVELARAEVAKTFVILDARSRTDYAKSHVPGARFVDGGAWKKAFGGGGDAAGWSKRIGGLGIDDESKVVVYDDNSTKDAARVWWILRYWGVRDARLLNGGWAGWKRGDFPIRTATPEAPVAVAFKATPECERLATRASVLASLADKSLQIVDTRSEAEHCGIDKKSNKQGGAIPEAKHLEWSDLVDKETQRFKPAAELRKRFAGAGIDLTKPAATHCQSGGRASVVAYCLELMGAKDVRNYYAGWSDWGNAADTPIVPGKAKTK